MAVREWDEIMADVFGDVGYPPPPGEFRGHLNTIDCDTTQEIARRMWLAHAEMNGARHTLDAARSHFASGGYRGDTSDRYYLDILRAFGDPIPEYPESLRAEHEARDARFWGGVHRAASALAASPEQVIAQETILEDGRRQADSD